MAGGPPSFIPDVSSGTHQQEVQALRTHNQRIRVALWMNPDEISEGLLEQVAHSMADGNRDDQQQAAEFLADVIWHSGIVGWITQSGL
jgi:hypothetical protein